MAIMPVMMMPVTASDADIHTWAVAVHMAMAMAVQMSAVTPAPARHLLDSRTIRPHIGENDTAYGSC